MLMYKNGIPISNVKGFLVFLISQLHQDMPTQIMKILKKLLRQFKKIISLSVKEKKWKGKEKDLLKYCGLE